MVDIVLGDDYITHKIGFSNETYFFILLAQTTPMYDSISRLFDCILHQREQFPQKSSLVSKENGKWEQIKDFEITPEEWTIEAGYLTPTMKIKRKVILEKYQNPFQKIYHS